MYWIPIDANFYQVVDFQKAKKQIDLCLIFRLVDVHILNFYSLFENLFCTKVLTDIFAIWCVKNQSQLELADELIDTSVEKSNKKISISPWVILSNQPILWNTRFWLANNSQIEISENNDHSIIAADEQQWTSIVLLKRPWQIKFAIWSRKNNPNRIRYNATENRLQIQLRK